MDLTFWLGVDGAQVWRNYLDQVEREAEALRRLVEDRSE